MKTTRRQELRTNELSQQIDQAGVYVKRNAALFTLVIIASAALVAGGFWYSNRQTTIESDAWARLEPPEVTDDAMEVIARYEAVANERLSDAITTTARLRIGNLAISEIANPTLLSGATPQAGSPAAELTTKARAAFQQIITDASDDVAAYGHAMMAMGVIEENAAQFDKARKWYERVAKEEPLTHTPFKSEAEYRLARLDTWAREVVFPPPPPMELGPPAPLGLNAPADYPFTSPGTSIQRLEPGDPRIPPLGKPIEPVEQVEQIPISVEPAQPAAAEKEPATEKPAAPETTKRAPTTQPAGN